MFVEKTDSVLGDVLSCPCGVESRLVSTGLEMSSSWISVMQASLGDLMPMSQMFVGCRSLIDCLFFFFFFPYLFLFWTCLFLCSELHIKSILILGAFSLFTVSILLSPFYVIYLLLT